MTLWSSDKVILSQYLPLLCQLVPVFFSTVPFSCVDFPQWLARVKKITRCRIHRTVWEDASWRWWKGWMRSSPRCCKHVMHTAQSLWRGWSDWLAVYMYILAFCWPVLSICHLSVSVFVCLCISLSLSICFLSGFVVVVFKVGKRLFGNFQWVFFILANGVFLVSLCLSLYLSLTFHLFLSPSIFFFLVGKRMFGNF